MLSRLLSLLWAVLLVIPSYGQDAVTVQVQNSETGQAVALAYVNVYTMAPRTLQSSVMSDDLGAATVSIQGYPVQLEVVALGYAPYSIQLQAAPGKILKLPLVKRFSSLDEVVVTGVVAPAKLQDALSVYQVIQKSAMQAQGAVTVSDALKNQLNINMGSDNILGSKTSMQGLKGDKVKILVDGMPVNGREFGEIDLGQINLNNVEKIEIVQGPMSVVYGTDALGGVINVITKKNKVPWQINAGGYYESVGRYNFDVAGSLKVKKRHQFSLGGARNFFQGWQPTDPLERSFLWKPKEQYIANFAYNYTAASSFRLQFASDFIKEKVTNKDANYVINPFYARAIDEYYRNTRSMTRLLMNGKAGKNGLWQSQNSYSLYYRIRNTYARDMVTLNQDLSGQAGSQDTTRFDDFTFRGNYANSLKKVCYTVGYDINLEHGTSRKIAGNAGSINDYAAYLNAAVPLLKEKLILQPALRYAYNSVYQAPLIPSMNILYKADEDVQFRFSYAKGFRAPSLKELHLHFYDNNHEIDGNPDLKAEQGSHFQLSGSWTAYRREANFIKLLLTGYYNDVFDQISLIAPDPNRPMFATYTNIDRLQNLIGSLQADAQLQNLYVQLGYSALHILNGDSSVFATSQQATATVQYQFPKAGVNIATFFKYFGRQARLVPTVDGGASFNGIVDPYSFWDASIEKNLWKNRIQLIVGVKNILDVQSSRVTGGQAASVHNGATDPGSQNIATGRSLFTSLRLTLQ